MRRNSVHVLSTSSNSMEENNVDFASGLSISPIYLIKYWHGHKSPITPCNISN